jgi:hypothetical protein
LVYPFPNKRHVVEELSRGRNRATGCGSSFRNSRVLTSARWRKPIAIGSAEVGRRPSEGDAGDLDDAGRCRGLDDGASGRGLNLQRLLADGSLRIVARGVKEDASQQ